MTTFAILGTIAGLSILAVWALYLAFRCDSQVDQICSLEWRLAEANRELEHCSKERRVAVRCSNSNAKALDAQREANAQLAAEKDYIIDVLRALVDGEEVFLDE